MYLHESDLFHDVVLITANQSNTTFDIVEKDYYVSLILKELVTRQSSIVFKGGTSLSKAYHVIDRFSEDIDVAFSEHIGESRRKKLKYDIIGNISEKLNLPIRNWDKTESDKDYNRYEFLYSPIFSSNAFVTPHVVLETALMSYSFPTEEKMISNLIFETLKDTEKEIIQTYDLLQFSMQVQTLGRTFIDKLFAVCDYYLLNRARRNSRHLYDIYKMFPYITFDESFIELVKEVRQHRANMLESVAPSARADVNLIEISERIKHEGFYRDDYEKSTKGLISDKLEYDQVIYYYCKIMKDVFG